MVVDVVVVSVVAVVVVETMVMAVEASVVMVVLFVESTEVVIEVGAAQTTEKMAGRAKSKSVEGRIIASCPFSVLKQVGVISLIP